MAVQKMIVFAAIVACLSTTVVNAHEAFFLGRRDAHTNMSALQNELAEEVDLLHELGEVAGREHRLIAETRVEGLVELLRPMFDCVPKNSYGNLDATSVRYVLHRLFLGEYGWVVRGLDAAGGAWNSSSPVDVFKGHTGEVHGLFDYHLGPRGFGLQQVAAFAATLEAFVHLETLERLESSRQILSYSEDQAVFNSTEVERVFKAYMLMYVLEMNHTTTTLEKIQKRAKKMKQIYPAWPSTLQFLRDVQRSVLHREANYSATNWTEMENVVKELAMQYGKWQNKECLDMKRTLMKIEEPGTGRVPLANFYGSALDNGSWQFSESVSYLRELGALDDTDPQRVSVIIPNYINSPSNCVAASRFYRVCCISECESLLAQIEKQIMSPKASPEAIVKIVAELPSDTSTASGSLPTSLKQRLREIASQHGGFVPLHGRLFAQWMHHVYPRECPYPHVTGTTKPMAARQWVLETGERLMADEADMRKLASSSFKNFEIDADGSVEGLPWSTEEELIVHSAYQSDQSDRDSYGWPLGRGLALFAAPFSMTLMLLRNFATQEIATGTPSKFVL